MLVFFFGKDISVTVIFVYNGDVYYGITAILADKLSEFVICIISFGLIVKIFLFALYNIASFLSSELCECTFVDISFLGFQIKR